MTIDMALALNRTETSDLTAFFVLESTVMCCFELNYFAKRKMRFALKKKIYDIK